MGRKDWERIAQDDNFVAVGGVPKKGRVLPILGGLLVLGCVGFVVSYSLPLFRAHEDLNVAYVKLAIHSREQQGQLEQAATALKRLAAERDDLKTEQGSTKLNGEAQRLGLRDLDKELRAQLSASTEKKLVALKLSDTALEVQFLSPTLFRNDAVAPTVAGKALMCQIANAVGKRPVQFALVGSATPADSKQRALKAYPSAWHLSVARGASAALLLADACKVPAPSLVPSGVPSTDSARLPTLTLKLSL